ncbi:hypothetical protein GCM10009837_69370 [Streptomyces durmitorensis]
MLSSVGLGLGTATPVSAASCVKSYSLSGGWAQATNRCGYTVYHKFVWSCGPDSDCLKFVGDQRRERKRLTGLSTFWGTKAC